MSWLIPSALGIAGAAAVVAVALHFIARSRPLAETLPTARFVPDRPIYARTRSIALTDLLLLAASRRRDRGDRAGRRGSDASPHAGESRASSLPIGRARSRTSPRCATA